MELGQFGVGFLGWGVARFGGRSVPVSFLSTFMFQSAVGTPWARELLKAPIQNFQVPGQVLTLNFRCSQSKGLKLACPVNCPPSPLFSVPFPVFSERGAPNSTTCRDALGQDAMLNPQMSVPTLSVLVSRTCSECTPT